MKYIKYIELDGKVPKHNFETFSTTHEKLTDAGIILDNSIVVVDFDERSNAADMIARMCPTFQVQTKRGFHLYYKRPKGLPLKNHVGKVTVGGFPVDYKTGTKSQATIKQGGKLREIVNAHHLEQNFNGLPELPFLLYPSKLKESLLGMKEGQGRNQALFVHLLATYEQYPQQIEDIGDLAMIINTVVFGKPLDDKEYSTLLDSVRAKLQNKSSEEQKWLNPKDIIMTAEVLVDMLEIRYYQNKLYFRIPNTDHFIHNDNKLLRQIDTLIKLKSSQHKELMQLFQVKAQLVEEDHFPIKLRDGYILDDDEVMQLDVDFTPYFLDIDFRPEAYDESVDQFLDFLSFNRKDLRLVIEEMMGHMLMTRRFPHKVFFLQGSKGGNGKSTFLKMVGEMMGDLASQLTLTDFNDATSVAHLDGRLVNIGDDIDASYLEQSKNFKTLASGDPIMIRPIYRQPFKLKNRATLVFTCNEMPTFKDKSGGIARRVVVIPCENSVSKRDHDIDAKLSSDQAKSYLLNLALEGMKRIVENHGELTPSITIEAKTKEYFISTDSVMSFLEETDVSGKSVNTVFNQYVAFCEIANFKATGRTEFGRRLKNLGYVSQQKKIDGKNSRIYVKVTDEGNESTVHLLPQ